MTDFSKEFYTVPEVAALMRVGERTIYNLVKSGRIECYKIGKQIRISAAELEKLKTNG